MNDLECTCRAFYGARDCDIHGFVPGGGASMELLTRQSVTDTHELVLVEPPLQVESVRGDIFDFFHAAKVLSYNPPSAEVAVRPSHEAVPFRPRKGETAIVKQALGLLKTRTATGGRVFSMPQVIAFIASEQEKLCPSKH